MSSIVRKNWAMELPDEVLLMILGEAVVLPNGINALRWFAINKIKLQPLLKIRGLQHIYEEAFYSKNKLGLYFAPRLHLPGYTSKNPEPSILYPQPRLRNFVRRLELHLVIDARDVQRKFEYDTNRIVDFQLTWLRDMAKGMKGFNHLKELTLCFDSQDQDSKGPSRAFINGDLEYDSVLAFRRWLNDEANYRASNTEVTMERPVLIKFPVPKLNFTIFGRNAVDDCEDIDCEHSGGLCKQVKLLQKHFTN